MQGFLLSRFVASLPFRRTTQLTFIRCNFNSLSSESNCRKSSSFTVTYLINSCGLSPNVAVETSKSLQLKDPKKPDSVLNLLRNYGFSETHISKLVRKRPRVLLAKPEKTLLPKLMFFRSIGLSCSDIPELLSDVPILVECSLEKSIIPRYEVLKSVIVDNEAILRAIKCTRRFSYTQYERYFVQNVEVLREVGVPQSSISFMVTNYPQIAFTKHAKFVQCIKSAKEMGLDSSRITFIEAVQVLARMKTSTWELKLRAYEKCGWPRDVAILAFKRFRKCMLYSVEKITKTMKFLVDEMGWPSEDIALTPVVLSYSLKRIIPRCSVVKILMMKGFVKKDMNLCSFIALSDKIFFKRYVIRFQDDVPGLLEIYKGHIDSLGGMMQS